MLVLFNEIVDNNKKTIIVIIRIIIIHNKKIYKNKLTIPILASYYDCYYNKIKNIFNRHLHKLLLFHEDVTGDDIINIRSVEAWTVSKMVLVC